jgi:hypothetical protein
MTARAFTVAFQGVEARLVEVQCAVTAGLPAFTMMYSIKCNRECAELYCLLPSTTLLTDPRASSGLCNTMLITRRHLRA